MEIKGFMKKIAWFLEEYAVELLVSLYLIYKMYITIAPDIYSYVSVWYALDYSYGFGSRLMIGSIMHLLFGDFIDKDLVYHFLVVMLLVLCLLVAVLSGMVYRKMTDKTLKAAILFIVAFYVASPASPEYLWTAENMGRLDTYLFINAIVLAIIYLKINNIYLKYTLFVVIGIFSLLIHQVYLMLFFPSLLVMLINDIFDPDEGRVKAKNLLCGGIAALILGLAFLYMQFRSGIYYDDLDILFAELSSHTNLGFGKEPLEAEYFWTLKDHFYKNQLPELRERVRFGTLTICMLIPVWGTYLYVWVKSIKSSSDKLSRLKYALMLLTNLIYLPLFALMTDWGRWFAAFFIVGFINILVLAYKKDEGICAGLLSLGKLIEKNGAIFLLFILYISSFEKFEGINMMKQVQDFFYATYDLKVFFFGR